MRLRRGIAAAAALGAMSPAAPVYAQYFEFRSSLTAAATYNKTFTDAAFPTNLTGSGPSATVSPSVSLVYETPRTLHTFTYGLRLNFLFTPDFELAVGPVSYNNRLSYTGRYTLSELSTVTLSLTLTHSPVNTMAVGVDASQTMIDPIPSGTAYMLAVATQETFTRQMAPEVSLTQTAGVTYNSPYSPLFVQPRTIGFQNAFTLQKQFAKDTLGVQLMSQTSYFTVGEGPGSVVMDPRTQIANSLSLTWNRTLNDKITTALVFGVTQVITPDLSPPTAVQPTGSATLNYRFEPAVATLTFSHQGAPNLATNSVNFVDMGVLRFSVPIGETGLLTSGSGGFTHMTPIGQVNAAPSDVIMGDVSLSWRPPTSQSFNVGLRGQVQRQSGGLDPNNSFTRLSASLNVTWTYPPAIGAMRPPDLPPALGSALPTGGLPSLGSPIEAPAEAPADAAPAPAPQEPAPPKP